MLSTQTLKTAIAIGILCLYVDAARADCFDDAAGWHGVNPWVLRAIAQVESDFRADTIVTNSNGTKDYGLTGTNSVHLQELAKFGITEVDLMSGCKSVFVSAWLLRKKVKTFGNTCEAIGAYHSMTPKLREAYIARIRNALARWSIPLNC